MIVRLTVDGVSRDLDLVLSVRESEECESLTGWTKLEWQRELGRQRGTACAFAWWLASVRAGEQPAGSFAELDFPIGDDFLEVLPEERAVPRRVVGDEPGPTGPGPTTAGT